jgi:hypothetical protein
MRWIALLLAATACAAETSLPEIVPPDTKVVIGIQVRRLLDSPLGRKLSADAGKSAALKVAGVDLLKDVDEVVIATSGVGQNPPSLLVLTGRFHAGTGEKYHDVPVMSVPQHADQILAILDETTALAGDRALVRGAIDRRGKGASAAAGLLERIGEMSGRYDVWGVGDHLPKSAQPGQMDSVDGFSFGAALREGLEATAEIHLRSAADAEKATAMLKMLEAMVQSQSSAAKFHFESHDGTLKVALSIPEAELKKAIEAQKTVIASAIMGQMRAAKPMGPVKPKQEAMIVNDSNGNTLRVTLPGRN